MISSTSSPKKTKQPKILSLKILIHNFFLFIDLTFAFLDLFPSMVSKYLKDKARREKVSDFESKIVFCIFFFEKEKF